MRPFSLIKKPLRTPRTQRLSAGRGVQAAIRMARMQPTKTRSAAPKGTPAPTASKGNWPDNEGQFDRIGEEAAESLLASLPGLGERRQEQLVTALGSHQNALRTLRSGDTETIANIEGIGTTRAQRLVHAAIGNHDDQFFATPRSARAFHAVQKRLTARAMTRPGKDRLRLLVPHPDPDVRTRRLAWCEQAAAEVEPLEAEALQEPLRQLAPLPPLVPSMEADVLFLFDNKADRERAENAGLGRWGALSHLTGGDTRQRIQEAQLVVHATHGEDHPYAEADHVVQIPHTLDARLIAPWGTLQRFKRARASLEAAATLCKLRGRDSASAKALQVLDEHPEAKPVPDKGDLETTAQVLLEEEIQNAEADLENLTVSGRDLMRALTRDLPAPVLELYKQAAKRANARLTEATGLELDAYTDDTPPQVDPGAIHQTASSAARKQASRQMEKDLKAAKKLVALEEGIEQELDDHFAFDARQAIGFFIHEHGLTAPEWGTGFLVEGLRPLLVGENAEAIDYRLGCDADGKQDKTRVALITGANSGGKTTLLESLTELVAMAHAGMPVAARRAILPPLESVHLYVPGRDRSAGALESMLLALFPLIETPGRRLVLADELEAVTELEAASEILAALIEGLVENGNHAVFATHLAPHLLPALAEKAREQVRIDGIEAHGIDEQGRLLVDRSPRLGALARSTPELIVKRLVQEGPPELADRFKALAKRIQQRP